MPPTSPHRPQPRDNAGRPCATRWAARPSRNAFAAAYPPWPGAPSTPETEENSTNAESAVSRVSSCRFRAPSTFGRSTVSTRSGVSAVTTPSSRTPAACTTDVSGCSAGIAARTGGQRGAVGDVAERDVDVHAQLGAQALQRGRAAAADQQEPPDVVLSGQVPDERAADRAGRAGDQDRAARVEVRRFGGRRGAHQPRDEDRAEADGGLRFPGGEDLRQDFGRGAHSALHVKVQQHERVRVLLLGRAHEPPGRGGGEVGDAPGRRDGTAGDDDQARVLRVLLGEPVLQRGEHAVGQLVRVGARALEDLDVRASTADSAAMRCHSTR